MVAFGFSGPAPWWIFAAGVVLAISLSALRLYFNIKAEKRDKDSSSADQQLSNRGQEETRHESDLNSSSYSAYPKFRTLYGRKPLLGVIIGLGIIVGNVLFFSFVIPARTSEEIITTVVLVIVGVGVAAFSNLIGLIRVSNGRTTGNRGKSET